MVQAFRRSAVPPHWPVHFRSSRSGKKVRRAVCKQLHGCVGNTRAIPGSGCVAQGRGKPKSAAIQPKHGHVDPDVETETLEALPHPRARYSTVFPILLRHGAQCCVPFSLPLPPATCRPRSHCAGAVPLQAAENLRGFQGARVSFRVRALQGSCPSCRPAGAGAAAGAYCLRASDLCTQRIPARRELWPHCGAPRSARCPCVSPGPSRK